jgi:hypothetical protein
LFSEENNVSLAIVPDLFNAKVYDPQTLRNIENKLTSFPSTSFFFTGAEFVRQKIGEIQKEVDKFYRHFFTDEFID